jgi:methionyl-tRNA synthetase
MMTNIFNNFFPSPVFYFILIWSLIWKGLALWRAARNNHLVWYIVILILNTVGILEILYIFIFGRKKEIKKIENR